LVQLTVTRRWIAITAGIAAAGVLGWVLLTGSQPAPAQAAACRLPPTSGPHAGMVLIPAGTFAMGDTLYPEEGPIREVSVRSFWMDRTEVTNADFAAFVKATGYVTTAERPDQKGAAVFVMPSGSADLSSITSWWRYVEGANWRQPGGPGTSIEGRDQFPVVAVTLADAEAYARWKGRRLPTEEEWERAARAGAQTPPDREQPRDANTWQGLFPLVDTAEDGHAGIAPVGCFKPNAWGLFDMVGNVWEMTATTYAGHEPRAQVIKGGSYLCAPNYCMRYRAAARQPQEADLGTSHVGFRTVLPAGN
jgi:sulfatase modifying factor 1